MGFNSAFKGLTYILYKQTVKMAGKWKWYRVVSKGEFTKILTRNNQQDATL